MQAKEEKKKKKRIIMYRGLENKVVIIGKAPDWINVICGGLPRASISRGPRVSFLSASKIAAARRALNHNFKISRWRTQKLIKVSCLFDSIPKADPRG